MEFRVNQQLEQLEGRKEREENRMAKNTSLMISWFLACWYRQTPISVIRGQTAIRLRGLLRLMASEYAQQKMLCLSELPTDV